MSHSPKSRSKECWTVQDPELTGLGALNFNSGPFDEVKTMGGGASETPDMGVARGLSFGIKPTDTDAKIF